MSSKTKSPWGVGAWALEAEAEEERAKAEAAAASEMAAAPQSFPSLQEASATKTKKKKGTTLTLSEFATGAYVGRGVASRQQQATVFESRGLTAQELLRLPTGPRERSPEELEHGRLGGGFRNYGSYGGGGTLGSRDSGGFSGRRDDGDRAWGEGGGRRGYGGGFGDEARRGPPSRGSDFEQMPSRADEVDNWAAMKSVSAPPSREYGRSDRYQMLGSGGDGGPSRADEADSWLGRKHSLPAVRQSRFGSGFRDSVDSDRWGPGGGVGAVSSMPHNADRERPRLVLEPRSEVAVAAATESTRTRPSPFGAARPREEVLAEKGLDWKQVDYELEIKKTSRPTSSHSSRPSSAQSSRLESSTLHVKVAELDQKPRTRVNHYGNAKPREILLEEHGKDWRKIDMELEHRSVDRPESEEEKLMKEEIKHLKEALSRQIEANLNGESDELVNLREQITAREKDLDVLIQELDDKVKFGQKAIGEVRPGSGAGRIRLSSDRPSSQSGLSVDSQGTDFVDRPRSRGSTMDIFSRAQDDRKPFHFGKEGRFFGSRSTDRPRPRQRW